MSGDHEHHQPQAGAVLDIGGGVGAVVVYAGPALDGAEIQLYAEDGTVLTHTEVHRREVGSTVVHAGLFPGVAAGRYRVDTGGERPVEVTVRGGEVVTVG